MRRVLVLLPLLALSSCAKKPGVSTTGATSSAAVDAPPPALAAVVPKSATWPDDVRRGRWKEAKASLDGLADADHKKPEIRFVRAFVAKKVGDDAEVVRLTEGLDLPPIQDAVRRLRAEAQLVAGPFAQAAAYFEERGGTKNLLLAARAYERGGKAEEARRAADKAVSSAKGATEIDARVLRMTLAEAKGDKDTAISDARWLAEKAPHKDEAMAVLERLAPGLKLSGKEREARAEKLAASGHADKALAELELAKEAPGASTGPEAKHVRGMVLFKARRYAEAAEVLAHANNPGTDEDDEFHAARALSRAQRDAEAIPRYDAIAKKKGTHAEEAEYLAARLAMLLGRTEEAAGRYAAYLRHAKRGKDREHAQHELALVELAKSPESARRRFAKLADDEDNKGEAARLRELEGVAALAAGDRDGAAKLFAEAMKAQPMSFAALAAKARLGAMGREAPPLLEPSAAGSAPALTPTLPTGPSLLRALGLDHAAEEALRPMEKELGAAHGGRSTEALCSLYGQLETAGRRYRLAQQDVKVETVYREAGATNRWAWECLYPRPYAGLVADVEAREKLPRGLVHAVMRQESSFDPEVVSPAHAVGLMQLLPSTAREVAKRGGVPFEDGSLTDANVNVDLGARYLALLLDTWKGNVALAVASYNAGPKAVSSWLRGGDTEIDVFVARIPYGETRVYVGRVLANRARYAYLDGGASAVPPLPLAVDPAVSAPADAF